MAVAYSYNALVDLETIEDYIAERSDYPDTARRFIERLTEALEVLGDLPNLGTPRDDLRPGIRQYIYRGYVVLYSVTDTGVIVEVVAQGRRDIERLFRP